MGKVLHVGNIPSYSTEEDVSALFGRFGLVEFVKATRDTHSGLSKGFALVEMSTNADLAGNEIIAVINISKEIQLCVEH